MPKQKRRTTAATAASSSVTAEAIALRAAELTGGDRQKTHGEKTTNHRKIATLWNAYAEIRAAPGAPLEPMDVAHMMVLLKIARTQLGRYNPDDWIDMTGYSAVAGEIAAKQRQ